MSLAPPIGGCDFYEGIPGNEAKRSWHTWVSAMSRNSCSEYVSGTPYRGGSSSGLPTRSFSID
jgi:hypothetical protein